MNSWKKNLGDYSKFYMQNYLNTAISKAKPMGKTDMRVIYKSAISWVNVKKILLSASNDLRFTLFKSTYRYLI